ncbi:glycosyltransferase [Nonomuraea sp. NPDC049625]|uniref:glycosyltransferase n=1 Tax=Nonomuraea sp. NPDC049625 TaxID=3155775 RepID=UPI003434BD68
MTRSLMSRGSGVDARPLSVAVVTPWFPTESTPYRGSFVATAAEAVSGLAEAVTVYHFQPRGSGRPTTSVPVQSTANVTVEDVFFTEAPFTTLGQSVRNRARAFRDHTKGSLQTPVVHAHVGLTGGWPAVQAAGRQSKVFVTEHASFLEAQLADDDARKLYEEVVRECTRFFCVSGVLRGKLVAAFPYLADKIDVAPNAVPIERITLRPEPVRELRRWLYLGGFLKSKGIEQVLDAFAHCRASRPELSLTMVGGGADWPWLSRRVADMNLTSDVTLLDAVPHQQALELLYSHDLLVHASHYETFGMTPIEAISSGMPVLVTRCGGPEETLSGVIAHAGELVPVADNGTELVSGYERLASRLPQLDLRRARATLERKYGLRAVADFYSVHYFGDHLV